MTTNHKQIIADVENLVGGKLDDIAAVARAYLQKSPGRVERFADSMARRSAQALRIRDLERARVFAIAGACAAPWGLWKLERSGVFADFNMRSAYPGRLVRRMLAESETELARLDPELPGRLKEFGVANGMITQVRRHETSYFEKLKSREEGLLNAALATVELEFMACSDPWQDLLDLRQRHSPWAEFEHMPEEVAEIVTQLLVDADSVRPFSSAEVVSCPSRIVTDLTAVVLTRFRRFRCRVVPVVSSAPSRRPRWSRST